MSYFAHIAENYQKLSLSREELAYYARHILLPSVGLDGQRKLKAARVLVVGAGGLGCPVLQALAGAGVGYLTIIDGDFVSISNLSRQWLHRYEDDGSNKAVSAKFGVESLNPFIEIHAVEEMLTLDNSRALIESHDLIIDATDDLSVRYLIDDVCAKLDRPWVHAALYRGGSQLTLFWARFGSTFRKLYPEPSVAPSCAGAGMLGANASLVGNLQAIEAIKLITGQGRLKLGELVSINSDTMAVQSFKLPDVTHPEVPRDKQQDALSERSLSASELRQALSIHEPLSLIDLRKDGSELSPDSIHQSEESILECGVSSEISGKAVLVCEEGVISSILAEALSAYDKRIYFLAGGAQALREMS